jgi:hypothetical protein
MATKKAASKTAAKAKERINLYVVRVPEYGGVSSYRLFDKKPTLVETQVQTRKNGGKWKTDGKPNSRITGNAVTSLCNQAGKTLGPMDANTVYQVVAVLKKVSPTGGKAADVEIDD